METIITTQLQQWSNYLRTKKLQYFTIFVLFLIIVLPINSTQVKAEVYQISDLTFPLSVSPGDNVSFIINQSVYSRYMHASGNSTNKPLEFWWSKNNSQPTKVSTLASIQVMKTGTWNLTFETYGRIAIAYYLPQICNWSVTSTGVDTVCPPISIRETTAFDLLTWSEGTQVVRVEGDVDAFFYDNYLQPLGQATEMTYYQGIYGIVVIVPHGPNSIVNFTISQVPQSDGGLTVWLVMIVVLMAIPVILIVLAKRRKKKEEGS